VVWQEVANQALIQEFYNMDNSLNLGGVVKSLFKYLGIENRIPRNSFGIGQEVSSVGCCILILKLAEGRNYCHYRGFQGRDDLKNDVQITSDSNLGIGVKIL
jgi:hypothetical protein